MKVECSVQYAHFSDEFSAFRIVRRVPLFRYTSVVNEGYQFVPAEHCSVWSVLMILIRLTEYERKYRNSIWLK